MRYNNYAKPKIKYKIITILLFIILSMPMIIFINQPLKVQAQETDIEGGDTCYNGETTSKGTPPSSQKSGWLIYVCDSNRQLLTPVYFFLGTNSSPNKSYNTTYLTSRIGNQRAIATGQIAPWGAPVTEKGSNWRAVKKDMDENGLDYVEVIFGDNIADKVEENNQNVHVILETVAWGNKAGMSAGNNAVASASGWAHMAQDGGCKQEGFGWMYFNKIQKSEYLENQWAGLDPPPPTNIFPSGIECISPSIILQYSMGMARLGTEKTDSLIHTYWQPNGSPGKPEPSDSPKNGMMNIVKSYYTEKNNGLSYMDDGTFYTLNCTSNISIDQEPEYKIVSWKITDKLDTNIKSTDGKKITWNPSGTVSGSGTDPKIVSLKTPQKCVYVLLKKVETEEKELDSNYVISESTITRQVHLSKPDSSKNMIKIQNIEFNWTSPAHKNSCGGHSYEDGKDSEGHTKYSTAYCSWGTWADDKLQFSLKNSKKEEYPDILATKANWENVSSVGSLTKRYEDKTRANEGAASFSTNNWDYACVLLRGKDKLTVADWKNVELNSSDANSDLAGVSNSGFTVANKDSGVRKTADYYEEFKSYFEDDSPDKETTRAISSGSGHGDCSNDTQTASLDSNLEVNVKVKLETYSGSEDGGTDDNSCDSSVKKKLKLAGFNKSTGKEVPSGGTVSFRPYIQMNYDTLTEHEKKAYVLGEHQRSLSPNDYAEISWNKQKIANLKLDSLQWSTHASAADFIIKTFGYDSLHDFKVLPGGATLSLTIDKKEFQKVQLATYQCIVTGSGKEQIDKAGGSDGDLTKEKAIAAHDEYVADVIDTLEKVNVEQWITMDVESETAWENGSAVGPNINLKDASHSNQKGSTETKYYFRGDGELVQASAGEGDLDVYPNPVNHPEEQSILKDKKHYSCDYYTFFVNTYGEIRYTVNDVYPNIDGNERKGKLANDTTAKLINNRTHIVDKLEAALELGTGDDTSGRSNTGRTWYNEAFDGITVMVQKTVLEVGYREPVQRTSVLDPKLTQTQKNQSDMFNIEKYNMSQYRTKNHSDKYDTDNKIGMFKGYDIYMDEMNMLFWSQRFFIPNTTVDDLH